jgi:hypothetical protein
MRWSRGATAAFTADFVYEGGAPASVTDVEVVIRDAVAATQDTLTATQLDADTWEADWDIPDGQNTGLYEALWSASADGNAISASEWFEVVDASIVFPSDAVLSLRNLVDRAFTGVTAFFTDDELHTLLMMAGLDQNVAASQAWMIKAATFAELVDLTEGGAERRLSQKFKNAMTMAKMFTDRAVSARSESLGALRTSAKIICLRKDILDPLGVLAGQFHQGDAMFVRTYPLKRFNTILG